MKRELSSGVDLGVLRWIRNMERVADRLTTTRVLMAEESGKRVGGRQRTD